METPPLGSLERQPDLNLVPLHAHRIGRDVDDGRETQHLARSQVEASPMSRALNLHPLDLAFSDGTAIVRAYVGDGEVLTGDVEDDNGHAVHVDQLALPAGQLIHLGDGEELEAAGLYGPVVEHSGSPRRCPRGPGTRRRFSAALPRPLRPP